MALSKKHYSAIAGILNKQVVKTLDAQPGEGDWHRREAIIQITGALCTYFATENPNFNAHRFKQAVYSRDNSGVASCTK